MRRAIAMIELIFALVIIAISVLTIPSMMAVANNATKGIMIDEDILKRMMGEIIKVSQARWDQNLSAPEFRPLWLSGDLGCSRTDGLLWYRANPDSSMPCDAFGNGPAMAASPATGSLHLNQGIEQLHNKTYDLVINATSGNIYTIPISYDVHYVTSTISSISAGGVATATWYLGSSTTPNPSAAGAKTHLKRVVVRCNTNNPNIDMALTFFKSNVGKFSE